ncbi:interleukin-22 receptor subunit alpha-2-like [Rhinatrema bivittatum]|uniref:interleukin-22 receptor subunit alpha-2-like n=1 Tax=Rhinatrema bivittatum TaxID=194408 RepID=UPI00112EA2E5|nr:interleukin-22 receptor subunit alpha-2-like [Rhinatrema bivittatum]
MLSLSLVPAVGSGPPALEKAGGSFVPRDLIAPVAEQGITVLLFPGRAQQEDWPGCGEARLTTAQRKSHIQVLLLIPACTATEEKTLPELRVSKNLELQDSIKPEKVEFNSLNFNSLLQWQPRRHIRNDTVYFVQYKVYGQQEWTNKMDCWGIDELFCDLTQEMSDVREPYYGRVKAVSSCIHSDWNTSWRFIPWWETKVGPPLLKMNPCNRSIEIEIKAPSSPYKGKNGRNISMKKYHDLLYRIFIINHSVPGKHKMYEGRKKMIKIENLTPGTTCCVVAETYLPVLDRSSEYSSVLCTAPL